MKLPDDTSLPFFTYGFMQPGQLAHFQIREFVDGAPRPSAVEGGLYVRDGLPLLQLEPGATIPGSLLSFKRAKEAHAYAKISEFEPDEHYLWDTTHVGGVRSNLLVARYGDQVWIEPYYEREKWDGWNDPLLVQGLKVVEETLRSAEPPSDDDDFRPLFESQMAYLLLWSAIERYLTLRYGTDLNPVKLVRKLAGENAFATALRRHVATSDRPLAVISDSRNPKDTKTKDPDKPKDAVDYFYGVRSNITHRGKAAPSRDFDIVRSAATELLAIFRDVLDTARADASTSKADSQLGQ